jgi:hypothetical protein
VYDPAHQVCVLFGGSASGPGQAGNPLNDTWEYDGASWVQRPVPGPPARDAMSLAYDRVRGVVVMFGGNTEAGSAPLLQDTWEYNVTWTLRASSGPGARVLAPMVFDPYRGRCVLTTGAGAINYADTWEWDGTTWEQRQSPGPEARFGAGMVFDCARAECLLFGGYVTTPTDDTWRFRAGPPAITEQPEDMIASLGEIVSFTVAAAGEGTLSYRWRRNGAEMADGNGSFGTATPVLTIGPIGTTHGGLYECVVTGACGTTLSSAAWLTIRCADAVASFDSLPASTGEVAGPQLDSYLNSLGISIGASTPGSRVVVLDDRNLYEGNAATAPSPHNLLTQAGINGQVYFTLHFAAPLSELRFTRPMIRAGPSGIIHPEWSLHVFNAAGQEVGSIGQGQIASFNDVPAQVFAVAAPGVVAARVRANTANAAFSSVLIDDLVLIRARPCYCSPDFDGDGDLGTDADIEAYFACLSGNCCSTCGSVDFNGDGDIGTDADIESFFRVLSGGSC